MSRVNQTNSDSVTDESRLVARARGGDTAAMGLLLEAYQQRVFGLCSRMVDHRDDAADLTQDVLMRMMTGLAGFDGRCSLSTWVYRIAVNTSISHLRRRRAARAGGGSHPGSGLSLPDSDPSWPESTLDREPTGEEYVQTNEKRASLLAALGRLGDEARVLLVLRDGRALAYENVAEILGLPIGTVKSRLFRARLALRKALQEMEKPAVKSDANQDQTA